MPPFVSEAQRRYFNANKKTIGESVVKHWDDMSKGLKLPEHVTPKKKSKSKKK